MKRNELSALLRAIADWLDRVSPEDIKNLVAGKARFVLEINSESKVAAPTIPKTKFDLENVKQRLEKAKSIEEGLQILRQTGLDKRKQPLEKLARCYEVGVRKSDNMADLAHRIVSAVVGSRLHAETMRNLPLGESPQK